MLLIRRTPGCRAIKEQYFCLSWIRSWLIAFDDEELQHTAAEITCKACPGSHINKHEEKVPVESVCLKLGTFLIISSYTHIIWLVSCLLFRTRMTSNSFCSCYCHFLIFCLRCFFVFVFFLYLYIYFISFLFISFMVISHQLCVPRLWFTPHPPTHLPLVDSGLRKRFASIKRKKWKMSI